MLNNKAHNKKKALSPSLALHLVVISVLSYIAWKVADKFIVLSSIPWGVITILIAPMASSIALFHKLSETKKNVAEDISRDESRRLTRMITKKRNNTILVLIMQIITIVYVAILSMIGQPEALKPYFQVLANITIVSMICSLYSIIPSVLGMKEINDFEVIIKTRKIAKKRLASAMKKLAK